MWEYLLHVSLTVVSISTIWQAQHTEWDFKCSYLSWFFVSFYSEKPINICCSKAKRSGTKRKMSDTLSYLSAGCVLERGGGKLACPIPYGGLVNNLGLFDILLPLQLFKLIFTDVCTPVTPVVTILILARSHYFLLFFFRLPSSPLLRASPLSSWS